MENYIVSESLFNHTLSYFTNDDTIWNLSLTEDEVRRMDIIHCPTQPPDSRNPEVIFIAYLYQSNDTSF